MCEGGGEVVEDAVNIPDCQSLSAVAKVVVLDGNPTPSPETMTSWGASNRRVF